MSKLNRDNFLSISQTDIGLERDLNSNNIDRQLFIYPPTTYQLKGDDIARPDLISYKAYGRFDYWWIIMKYNGIDDVWNEIYPGMLISLPDARDINAYVTEYSRA